MFKTVIVLAPYSNEVSNVDHAKTREMKEEIHRPLLGVSGPFFLKSMSEKPILKTQ